MTNEPQPLPPGVERLPSGRFRAKLRDPTRPGQWMPGGSFASVAPWEPQGASRVTPQMEHLWNTARAVIHHVADGALPEAAVFALLEAVEALPLLALARDLRGAQGRLRARAALSLAMEAAEFVSQTREAADSADCADSEVSKCL